MKEKKRILVVDDDQFVLKVIETALTEDGTYEATVVANAEEALKIKERRHFDLIITDIIMPSIDGITLIDEIRKYDRNIAIIAMSGGDDNGNVDDYITLSQYFANETLIKPFSKEHLLQTINTVLHQNDPNCLMFF